MESVVGNGKVEKEIDFLRRNLQDFRIDGSYCYGYIKEENYDNIIEQFLALSSTCFVIMTTESHFRPKGHKRYSEAGKASDIFWNYSTLLHSVHYCYYGNDSNI